MHADRPDPLDPPEPPEPPDGRLRIGSRGAGLPLRDVVGRPVKVCHCRPVFTRNRQYSRRTTARLHRVGRRGSVEVEQVRTRHDLQPFGFLQTHQLVPPPRDGATVEVRADERDAVRPGDDVVPHLGRHLGPPDRQALVQDDVVSDALAARAEQLPPERAVRLPEDRPV